VLPCQNPPGEWIYQTWASSDGHSDKESQSAPQGATSGHEQHGTAADEWIELHTDSDFSAFVDWLRSELNREAECLDPSQKKRLQDIFSQVCDIYEREI